MGVRSFRMLVPAALAFAVGCGGPSRDDPCSGVSCSSRGFCVADQGQAYCACIAGFHPEGLACVVNDPVDPCRGVACSGHGSCRNLADGPSCACDPGYRLLEGDECAARECDLVCVPIPPPDGGEVGETADDGDSGSCIPAGEERCNGQDDDCDGLTDEDFDLDFDRGNCGTCGRACGDATRGTGQCVLGTCEMICEPGWSNLDGIPENGCEAACVAGPTPAENTCDGRDDDCDGTTDEDWLTADTCGYGLCRRSSICHDGGITCRPRTPPAATDATCDGVDDDCDGLVDDECGGADADADADADVPSVCGNSAVEAGEECDDGNLVPRDGCEPDCTFSCHDAGDCDDGNPCTTDTCGPAGTGRLCTNPVDVGATCDDGNECTSGEACDASGACSGGTSTCTCGSDPDCASHEDGDLCNGTLICSGHACVVDPATVVDCPTNLDTDCRRNTCNPGSGNCNLEPINEGLACNDGEFCTLTDRCRDGACEGTGTPCAAGPCATGCDEDRDECRAVASGTVCRPAAGPCDGEETCDGSSTDCPADAFRPSSYTCRTTAGTCDTAESCTGFSPGCPGDAFRPSSTVCRPSGGICDLQENCTGSSEDCPADTFQSSSTECRAATGPCDVAERCTGSSVTCPGDAHASDGTVCQNDGTICGEPKDCHICSSGACVLNGGHYDASCTPSCGVIATKCHDTTDCCWASDVCTRGDHGPSNDCEQCCIGSCCTPSGGPESACLDGRDNDCDALTDCDDPDCHTGYELVCNDSRDNDCDGLWDCDDPDCYMAYCGAGFCLTVGCCGIDPCLGCDCGEQYSTDCGVYINCGYCSGTCVGNCSCIY